MEIFRREWETPKGKEATIVDADFLEDGTLRVSGVDYGAAVEGFWGDDDYEYWMDVTPEDSKQLFLLILKEAFNSDMKLTFGHLKEICKANGIDPKFDYWI
jgi:hypothetical protein